MANIFDVAKYILDSIGGEISTMKLQKLCYYSQAYTLAWDDMPLFTENFYRWDNGPVCKDLFDIHRGCFNINSKMVQKYLLSEQGLAEEEKNNINLVLEGYGHYSGSQLSDITHRESPWKDTPKDMEIEPEVMKSYYRKLIEDEK